MRSLFTLTRFTFPDGCIGPDIAPCLAFAKECANTPLSARIGFPRFSVKVDGETLETNRADVLAKWLGQMAIGAKCQVFRNAAKCATIDFDNTNS